MRKQSSCYSFNVLYITPVLISIGFFFDVIKKEENSSVAIINSQNCINYSGILTTIEKTIPPLYLHKLNHNKFKYLRLKYFKLIEKNEIGLIKNNNWFSVDKINTRYAFII